MVGFGLCFQDWLVKVRSARGSVGRLLALLHLRSLVLGLPDLKLEVGAALLHQLGVPGRVIAYGAIDELHNLDGLAAIEDGQLRALRDVDHLGEVVAHVLDFRLRELA